MNKSDRTIRKFNPGIYQSDEEVIDQFVGREEERNIVLEVLRGNIDSPSCQHVLVVAPRGRGKTMLLARIAAELNINAELSERFLSVRFMEESHEIFNLADFWLETLFHLAQEIARHDPELARKLRDRYAELIDRWDEEDLAGLVLATVLTAATQLGKKLVLMVENLQMLCENVEADFGEKLCDALQSESQIMLLATATSRFEGLEDAGQPFFELFRIVDLEPLNTEDCCSLWQVVSGDEVAEREIRPLEILTGGNPRLLVLVAEFTEHRSLIKLMEELVTLIDDHTEYFRSHLEAIPRLERRVYLAVMDLWQPSSTGEIAGRARMAIRNVSTMISRLVNRGVVEVEGTGRKRLYKAAERLHSIYYKLRHERDEAAVVESLIFFMAVYYREAEWKKMFYSLVLEAAESKGIREGFGRVLAAQPHIEGIWSIIQKIKDTAGQLEEIKTALEERKFKKVIEISESIYSSRPELGIAVLPMKALAYETLKNFTAMIETNDEIVKRFGDSENVEIQKLVANALLNKGLVRGDLGDFRGEIAAYNEVIENFGDTRIGVGIALSSKGMREAEMGRAAEALQTCKELEQKLDTLPKYGRAWIGWRAMGVRVLALMVQKNHRDALKAFRSVYAAFLPNNLVIMHDMQRIVSELIANGASKRELVEILSSDKEKADALVPLIVALQQLTGDVVRAPDEVLAVAEDINKDIEKRIANRE